jgi:hypothetical protein
MRELKEACLQILMFLLGYDGEAISKIRFVTKLLDLR